MAKRWRRQPNEKGLAGICQGTRGYELRENGEILAHVAALTSSRYEINGWYWYGFGQNTCGEPTTTAEEAKEQVKAFIKAKGL